MNIIAIDCGASFLKGAFISNGKIIRRKESSSPKVHGNESIFEIIQINELVSRVKDTILELAENEKEVTLCISNEMHGFILAHADGTPYTDYVSWQKEYGNIEIDEKSSVSIITENDSEEVLKSGMPLRAGLPSSNLLYLYRKGYLTENDLHFYTLGDYLIRQLAGIEPVCHPTNAAASGLYDVNTGKWNQKYINDLTGGAILFPKIGDDSITFVLDELVIHAFPAIGDQQAALLGAGFVDEDAISYNLGTGSQVSVLVREPNCSNTYQIRPYFNNYYLRTLPHIPSGRALNVYIRFIKDILAKFGVYREDEDIWNVALNALVEERKSKMKCDLSFFENTITDSVNGTITEIDEYGLNLSELMHSIFISMADNYMIATRSVLSKNQEVNKVVFSGGVARKIEYLRKRILDNYSENIEVVVASDETLIGLYYYAKLGE